MEKSILKIGISSVLLLILVTGCGLYGKEHGFDAKAIVVANSNNLDPVHVDFLGKNVRLEPGEKVYLEKYFANREDHLLKLPSVQEPLKLSRMGVTYYERMIVIKNNITPVRIMVYEEQEWGNFRVTYKQ